MSFVELILGHKYLLNNQYKPWVFYCTFSWRKQPNSLDFYSSTHNQNLLQGSNYLFRSDTRRFREKFHQLEGMGKRCKRKNSNRRKVLIREFHKNCLKWSAKKQIRSANRDSRIANANPVLKRKFFNHYSKLTIISNWIKEIYNKR